MLTPGVVNDGALMTVSSECGSVWTPTGACNIDVSVNEHSVRSLSG